MEYKFEAESEKINTKAVMNTKIKKLALHVLLITFGVFTIFPFVWMFLSSFKTNAEIVAADQTFFPQNFTLGNYQSIQENMDFFRMFFNSLLVAIVQTLLVLYISSISGYVLSKYKFKLRKKIFFFIIGTMMIPWTVTIIPRYFIFQNLGMLDSYWALILPVALSSFGIFLMKQNIDSIPTGIIEAARVDGAGEFYIFHRIILPMLKNSLSALAIFQFLWSWEDFLWPYLVMSTQERQLLPVGLNMYSGQYGTDYGGLFAATSLSIIPVVIVYIIFQKRFVKGIAGSAVKG